MDHSRFSLSDLTHDDEATIDPPPASISLKVFNLGNGYNMSAHPEQANTYDTIERSSQEVLAPHQDIFESLITLCNKPLTYIPLFDEKHQSELIAFLRFIAKISDALNQINEDFLLHALPKRNHEFQYASNKREQYNEVLRVHFIQPIREILHHPEQRMSPPKAMVYQSVLPYLMDSNALEEILYGKKIYKTKRAPFENLLQAPLFSSLRHIKCKKYDKPMIILLFLAWMAHNALLIAH